jgi:heterodisulfide reductase subunit A
MTKEKIGAVLIVGGGVAGIQAALDLADSGFKVHLLDQSPSIGGVMAQLDKTFPTNDCAMCILAPKLVTAGRHPNIDLVMNAEIRSVEGEEGHFKVRLIRKPRRVNEQKCTGCGVCAQKCPVEAIDEFNQGLSERGAIYVNYLQAVPLVFAIDRDKCIGCGTCQEVCKAGAIEYDEEEKEIVLDVGSIILAPGFEEFDSSLKSEYGYSQYPNVISSIEFERILSASGPYGGMVLRPSDGEVPRRVAFIQCVGSRDAKLGNNYCSSACCMYAIKEAVIAKEHNPDLQCTIFFMDIRAYGKEFDDYYSRAEKEHGVRFVRSRVSTVEEVAGSQNLIVRHVVEEEPKEEEFDLVVLSVGMTPPKHAEELAKTLGIELNKYKFCSTQTFSPLDTSRHGIYVCGAFSSPKDIPESVAQASGAAARAASLIAPERGKLTVAKELPPEIDISGEEPRIGVFVCHCGINIGGIVDVPEVVEYAKTLPNVAYAEDNLYTCSQDTQKRIREKIKEHNLNRVVVASCTPRTHEPLFRETIREAGLNIYLFEMANIRDQCSWVHMHEHEKATEKAKDLVRSIVAKARLLRPLKKPTINVVPVGLVIGGGLSGMTAALELAKQGFEVHLVEKEKELGGNLRHIHYVLGSEDPQEQLSSIVREVSENEKIHVHLGAEIASIEGYVGNFKTTLNHDGEKKEIGHGIVIVATGAVEYKPTEYLYGEDERVLTQRELEERLAKGEFNAKTVVMIQCVGSRNEERPNCSRICCVQAVKNALKIKELSPETDVYVLYKDVRTYGFNEDYYREVASKGVLFIRYDDENKPTVTRKNGALKVLAMEPVLKTWFPIKPDLLVLSVATIPNPDNEKISEMLKVPLSKDGFFLEAHMKLRPVDFATDGVFLCGLAHSPKLIEESISQACGAAARAITILSKKALEVEGAIASVNEDLCSGCRICEAVCEYGAIKMEEKDGKLVSIVLEALCKGCGTCGSSCPTGAITMLHFTDDEILAQVRAALKEEKKYD